MLRVGGIFDGLSPPRRSKCGRNPCGQVQLLFGFCDQWGQPLLPSVITVGLIAHCQGCFIYARRLVEHWVKERDEMQVWMMGSFDDLIVQFLTLLTNKYVDLKNEEENASRAMQVCCCNTLRPPHSSLTWNIEIVVTRTCTSPRCRRITSNTSLS